MPELWTLQQIADHYSVDYNAARYWSGRDWFPEHAFTSGKSRLWHPADVKRAVANYRRRNPRNPDTGRRRTRA